MEGGPAGLCGCERNSLRRWRDRRGTTMEGEHLRLQAAPSEEAEEDNRGGAVTCADTYYVPAPS